MAKGYWIPHIDVSDPEGYKAYMAATPPAHQKYSGVALVRGGRMEVVEGARPDGTVIATSRGVFEGRIGLPGEVPRGDNGFGYDPLFLLPAPDTRTSAELSPDEKNRRSHRGAAARAMAARVRSLTPSAARAAPAGPPGTPPAPAPTPPPRGASNPRS